MDDDIQEFLEHFGIKGQKWGVRKQRTAKEQARREKAKATRKKWRKDMWEDPGNRALVGVAGSVAVLKLLGDMDRNPQRYIRAAKFAQSVGNTSLRAASRAVQGSKLIFAKDMIVFAPGTGPRPGTYESAAAVRLALTAGRKALTA